MWTTRVELDKDKSGVGTAIAEWRDDDTSVEPDFVYEGRIDADSAGEVTNFKKVAIAAKNADDARRAREGTLSVRITNRLNGVTS